MVVLAYIICGLIIIGSVIVITLLIRSIRLSLYHKPTVNSVAMGSRGYVIKPKNEQVFISANSKYQPYIFVRNQDYPPEKLFLLILEISQELNQEMEEVLLRDIYRMDNLDILKVLSETRDIKRKSPFTLENNFDIENKSNEGFAYVV